MMQDFGAKAAWTSPNSISLLTTLSEHSFQSGKVTGAQLPIGIRLLPYLPKQKLNYWG
jgi:hypothetical protein